LRLRASAQRLALIVAAFVIVFSSLTNLYLFAWRFYDLSRYDYPYYLHRDEIAALRWLERNAQPDDVVLSSLELGQYVPAETGAHAFLAHWAQTVDFYGKSEMVSRFFDSQTSEAERLQIVTDYDVDFILLGPAERALSAEELSDLPSFQEVYAAGKVKILKPISSSGR
jgi:uncharacterized membrane protein